MPEALVCAALEASDDRSQGPTGREVPLPAAWRRAFLRHCRRPRIIHGQQGSKIAARMSRLRGGYVGPPRHRVSWKGGAS